MRGLALALGALGIVAACGGGGTDTGTDIDTNTDGEVDAPVPDAQVPDALVPDAMPICAAPGSAELTGSAGGVELAIVGALQNTDGFLMLHEEGATCAGPGPAGYIILAFCEITPGEYTVIGGETLDCAGAPGNVLAQQVQGGSSDYLSADGGTVTIHGELVDCDSGEFSLEFGADTLTGSFSAVLCPN